MATGRPRKIGVRRTASGRATRALQAPAEGLAIYAVYFVSSGGRVKVGFTGNLAARLCGIETNSGHPAQLLGVIHVPGQRAAIQMEADLHRELTIQGKHLRGEWFDLSRAQVATLLERARRQGLRASGGDDATEDIPILSSLAYAADKAVLTNTVQGGHNYGR